MLSNKAGEEQPPKPKKPEDKPTGPMEPKAKRAEPMKLEAKQTELMKQEALLDQKLLKGKSKEELIRLVFEVAREQDLRPGSLFNVLYQILLGRRQGPRFGPLVVAMGKENVLKELEKAVNNQ